MVHLRQPFAFRDYNKNQLENVVLIIAQLYRLTLFFRSSSTPKERNLLTKQIWLSSSSSLTFFVRKAK